MLLFDYKDTKVNSSTIKSLRRTDNATVLSGQSPKLDPPVNATIWNDWTVELSFRLRAVVLDYKMRMLL